MSDRGGNNNLWLEDIATGEAIKVGQAHNINYLRSAFSKDNTHLSYLTVDSASERVLTVTNISNPSDQVLKLEGVVTSAWSSIHKDMLYVLQASEQAYDISVVSLHDKRMRKVITGLPALQDFSLTPADNLVTLGVGEKTLKLIQLDSSSEALTTPVEFNSSMYDSTFGVELDFERHWQMVGGYAATYFIDAEGDIFIQFYPTSAVYAEVENIDLIHQNRLESFTLTENRETPYYSNYSLPHHTLYKFSALSSEN